MKARLLTDAYKQDTGADLLELRVAEDLIAVVAYDLPENVMLPERARRAPVRRRARSCSRSRCARRARRTGLALERYELHGAPLYVLTGESFFTATHALWADRFYEPAAELGTLVGVPTRHIVVAHPIRDRGALTVIAQMLQLVARYFNDGPGSLSDGPVLAASTAAWSGCETWIDEQGPHLSPSPRFARVLEALCVSDPERWRADSVGGARALRHRAAAALPAAGREDVAAQRPLEQVVARAQALVCVLNAAHGAPLEKVRAGARRARSATAGSSESERAFLDDPGDQQAARAADVARRGAVRADLGAGGGGRAAAEGNRQLRGRAAGPVDPLSATPAPTTLRDRSTVAARLDLSSAPMGRAREPPHGLARAVARGARRRRDRGAPGTALEWLLRARRGVGRRVARHVGLDRWT